MLSSLKIKNFTLLPSRTYEFSKQLNVIVGENGAGKTHLLKLLYCMQATVSKAPRTIGLPIKAELQRAYANKLMAVFRPDSLSRLIKRSTAPRLESSIDVTYSRASLNARIKFSKLADKEVKVDMTPEAWETESALYLPTRELMTIFPNFVATYENYDLGFEETWRDTCVLLGRQQLRGPRQKDAIRLMKPIEEIVGDRVSLSSNGRFYLGNIEMPLLSEGYRKLATLMQLIANGVIAKQSYIFWDEPEANLNPKLIRLVAQVIDTLCQYGVQIFIATHSYFLLKELEMLGQKSKRETQFFSLYRKSDAGDVECEVASHLDGLNHIVSLDEEAAQYDRELDSYPIEDIRLGEKK